MNYGRGRKSSMLSWTLVLTLTLSPVMAQNLSPADSSADVSSGSMTEGVRDSDDSSVSIAVPVEPRVIEARAAFQNVIKRSITMPPLTAPAPRRAFPRGQAPGDSRWIILAGLIGAGIITAVILLWPDGQDPVGTVITPGPPAVAVPGGQ